MSTWMVAVDGADRPILAREVVPGEPHGLGVDPKSASSWMNLRMYAALAS